MTFTKVDRATLETWGHFKQAGYERLAQAVLAALVVVDSQAAALEQLKQERDMLRVQLATWTEGKSREPA